MIITIGINYPISSKNLLVKIESPANEVVLDLSQPLSTVELEFDLPIQNQVIDLKFCCDDLDIINHPVTVTNITLDNFYQYNSALVYRGIPEFDQQFLLLAEQKNMFLDPTVNDSNRLDFTGKLVYKFVWPFYKNLFP